MKTIKKLSERKLRKLEQRILAKKHTIPPMRAALLGSRLIKERVRRLGLI